MRPGAPADSVLGSCGAPGAECEGLRLGQMQLSLGNLPAGSGVGGTAREPGDTPEEQTAQLGRESKFQSLRLSPPHPPSHIVVVLGGGVSALGLSFLSPEAAQMA